MADFTIHDLERRVHERAKASPEVSYTRKLLDRGVAQCAKKLGEEAIETIIAALGQDERALTCEAADLLYHLLVLLASKRIALADVLGELASRIDTSGLAEKAARTAQSGLDEKAARKHS